MKHFEFEHMPIAEGTSNTSENKQESVVRDHTKKYAPLARGELAGRIKMVQLRKELGILTEEEAAATTRALKEDFDALFTNEAAGFESEAQERSVAEISKKRNVLFVHSMPFDGIDQQSNTSMNNSVVVTGLLSTEERIGLLLHEEPSISCSTVSLDDNRQYGPGFMRKTMYPFGVVIDEGTVLSAHRYDGGIATLSRTAKYRKYDTSKKDTSIQGNIEAQIEHAVEGPFSRDYMRSFEKEHGKIDTGARSQNDSDYNELVVEKPHVSGFYVDADITQKMEEQMKYKEPKVLTTHEFNGFRWNHMKEFMSKYPGVPIFVREHGVVHKYMLENGEFIDSDRILFSKEQKEQDKVKDLKEYDFPHATHAKFENRRHLEDEMTQEHGHYDLLMTNFGKIVSREALPMIINAESWKYSAEMARSILEIFNEKNVNEDEIIEAVVRDYQEAYKKIDTMISTIKEMARDMNVQNLFHKDSTLKAVPKFRHAIRLAMTGFIEEIRKVNRKLAEEIESATILKQKTKHVSN